MRSSLRRLPGLVAAVSAAVAATGLLLRPTRSTSDRSTAHARPPVGFTRGVAAARLLALPRATDPVADDDLADLPHPVRRYLRAMGVVGPPRTRSFRAHLRGRFRRGPEGRWMPCDAWQYNSVEEIARLFRMGDPGSPRRRARARTGRADDARRGRRCPAEAAWP